MIRDVFLLSDYNFESRPTTFANLRICLSGRMHDQRLPILGGSRREVARMEIDPTNFAFVIVADPSWLGSSWGTPPKMSPVTKDGIPLT